MLLQENMVVADRFRLVRMIGKGGMGSVWEAMHLSLDRTCAVKFIEGELANVAEAHARFEREAKAAAKLHSPHVVQILDHGVWQGHPFIAMELLDGEDLGKRLVRVGGMLPPNVTHTIIGQVCRALSKAHQAGIVHRDLKPDNIFLVKDDDGEVVKILDFGVAKQTQHGIDGSNTKTGAMLGTPYYMSPEQAQGIKSVDSRSDLWSLAVIVFQCLTGRLPFESEALGDLLVKIIVNPIPVPSAFNPQLPASFDRWWTKAADRNPDNRYQTAKEFAQELGAALGVSAGADGTDRNALRGFGGGTAVMANGPGTEILSNVPNTPMPGAQTAAMAMGMGTPNPQYPSSPMLAAGAPMGAPHPGASTGSPVASATFSGVEPPAGLPRKSPPVALFIGLGAFALVGIVLGGFAVMRKPTTAHGGSDPGGSASITAPAESASVAGKAGGETTPATATATATAEPTATAPATAATATATAATTTTAATAATTTAKSGAGGGAPRTGGATAGVAAKPAASAGATAQPATKPTGAKPINLGF